MRKNKSMKNRKVASKNSKQKKAISRNRKSHKGLSMKHVGVNELFTALHMDHENVAQMIDQLISGEQRGIQGKGLFNQMQYELDVHATAEEEVLYPHLAEEADTEKNAEAAQEEHQEIRSLLKELESMTSGDERFEHTLLKLKKEIEHHVKHEEGEIFSKMEEVFNADQLSDMAKEFQVAKEALGGTERAA
jgi:hemerythrin superfamily protein